MRDSANSWVSNFHIEAYIIVCVMFYVIFLNVRLLLVHLSDVPLPHMIIGCRNSSTNKSLSLPASFFSFPLQSTYFSWREASKFYENLLFVESANVQDQFLLQSSSLSSSLMSCSSPNISSENKDNKWKKLMKFSIIVICMIMQTAGVAFLTNTAA